MTQQWPHNSQSRALFASPPSTGLPYPSYTPFPSRTNTPAYSVSRSSSSSGSFGHQSVGHSSVGKRSKGSWKSLGHPKRSQTAPWKGTQYGSPSGTIPRDMSYYQYYQQAPGWATAQYEPLPPPMPSYHPAANCKSSHIYSRSHGEDVKDAQRLSPELTRCYSQGEDLTITRLTRGTMIGTSLTSSVPPPIPT